MRFNANRECAMLIEQPSAEKHSLDGVKSKNCNAQFVH